MGRRIVSVDIGTSTIRAVLYDDGCRLLATCEEKVTVNVSGYGDHMKVEIEPDVLFAQFTRVVRAVLLDVDETDDVSMAICCQRNSFLCWNKDSLAPVHNIVCWNDCRARDACEEWNKSYTIRALNVGGAAMHWMTGMSRFLAARRLRKIVLTTMSSEAMCFSDYSRVCPLRDYVEHIKFLSAMVPHRFIVTYSQNEELAQLHKKEMLTFGCLETWLLSRLTGGKITIAEASNVSATGLFDPWINAYNTTLLNLIGFQATDVLADIVDSASEEPLALVESELFGRTIPVRAVLADQQSAVYGSGCWEKDDIKISLGTGTFVDLTTGEKPHASMKGLYPLVGWRLKGVPVYVAEGNDSDTAVLLRWAENIGLIDNVADTAALADSVDDCGGAVFVPAFGGLQTPINDGAACCGFLGLRPDTTKGHMIRAILESIAFRVFQIFETMKKEVNLKEKPRIRICGGVANNDFICQAIADMVECEIERMDQCGLVACRGVALLAGLVNGMWSHEELKNMITIEKTFKPIAQRRKQLALSYETWLKAVQRCKKFYS